MEAESAMKNVLSGADIGIIGGADGPTAVFVARSAFQGLMVAVLILLCLAVCLFFHRIVRRKKRSVKNRHKP